jgi:hypothetical protein
MGYPIGSVSSGTLDTGVLLRAFADELLRLNIRERSIPYAGLIREAQSIDPESDDAGELLDDLTSALCELAGPYFYFGAHPGDGADFGFWLPESFAAEFDGLRVSDTSEVPDDYNGEVLHVNGHGNATLYAARAGHELVELWSVV